MNVGKLKARLWVVEEPRLRVRSGQNSTNKKYSLLRANVSMWE